MAKAMISQPMAGKTEKEIVETRENAITFLKERGYDIVNTLFTDDWYSDKAMQERGVVQIPLCFLAKSLAYHSFIMFLNGIKSFNSSLTDVSRLSAIEIKRTPFSGNNTSV